MVAKKPSLTQTYVGLEVGACMHDATATVTLMSLPFIDVQLQRAAISTGACSATIGLHRRPITVVRRHRCHGNSTLLMQQQHRHH